VSDLSRLLLAIGAQDRSGTLARLEGSPALATAGLGRDEEFFLEARRAQVYAGDTALHAAAFSYDVETARDLVGRGADIRARNRRGGEPLHAAVMGGPGWDRWDPDRQRAIIRYLVEAGAVVDAAAAGGATPLHRAVRNRCSAAVEALLDLGADPRLPNDRGSTATDLAQWTTGRGGTGSTAARAEQAIIVELLARATA
jgi:Ankyrin repeats (3 copies)